MSCFSEWSGVRMDMSMSRGGTAPVRRKLPMGGGVISSTVPSVMSASSSTMFRSGAPMLSPHPLKDKDFVLDVENQRDYNSLRDDIRKLGGRIVDYVVEDKLPYCFISDHPHVEKLMSKNVKINPQLLQRLPMLLRDAVRLNVKVRCVQSFRKNLDGLRARVRTQKNVQKAPTKVGKSSQVQMRHLTGTYIKIDDLTGQYGPMFKEFQPGANVKQLFVGRHGGRSLFHKITPETIEKRAAMEKERIALEREAAARNSPIIHLRTPPTRRTSRLPRTPKNGFCEVCHKNFTNHREHFSSREHLTAMSRPGLYDEVDELCGSYVDYIKAPTMRVGSRRTRQVSPSPSTTSSEQSTTEESSQDTDDNHTIRDGVEMDKSITWGATL